MLSPNEYRLLTEKYKGLEYLNLPIALADNSFSLLYFNSAFSRLFMQNQEVFPIRDFYSLFETFNEKISILKQAGLSAGHLQSFIIPEVRLKNSERYFDLHVAKFNPELDHLEGFSVTCVEVTERQKEIRSLKELSEHHLGFLAHTTSGVVIHQDGIIMYMNEQGKYLLSGNKELQAEGKSFLEFFSDSDKAIDVNRIKNLLAENGNTKAKEEKFVHFSGNILDVETFSYPILHNAKQAFFTIFTDISQRKLQEKEIAASQKKYSSLVENLKEVIFQTDNDGRFTFLNQSWQDLTGFLIEDTLGKSALDYLQYGVNTESFYQKIRKLISSGVQNMHHEMLVKTKYHNTRYVDVKLQTIHAENNTIKGISGVIIDTHAQKLAQLELKKIESNLKEQNRILVSLAKSESIYSGDFDTAIQEIAKVSAEALHVSRVNIWQFNEDYSKLSCMVNYSAERNQFIGCINLSVEEFPIYFKNLIAEKYLTVSDTEKDFRVSEFKEFYTLPAGILSLMDMAILFEDKLWGVICFEQKESRRNWTIEDQSFARSISDFIQLAMQGSQQKKIKTESAKKDRLYRTLVEQSNDAIIIVDKQDRVLELNNKVCELSGYSKSELFDLDLRNMFPKRFQKEGRGISETIRTKERFIGERILVRKGGEEFIAEISAVILPDESIQAVLRDITERKQQEKALKESESRLEMALKGAELGTWDFFIQEDKLIHNKTWGELLGYSFEVDVVNEHFMDKFVHPDDVAFAYEAFEKHLKGETQYYEATIRMLASNGEWRWILDKGKVVEWDSDGKPLRASGIHQDVTALKSYEKEIQQQKTYLQQIINAIPNLIYVKNMHDEFVMVNKALADFIGTSSQDLLQYHSAQKSKIHAVLKPLFEKDFEVFISRKPFIISDQQLLNPVTGESRWLQSIKVPLADAEGNYSEILSVSTDITELKIKETELAELNEKLEIKAAERTNLLELANKELETFNYSVSHDLRTPLRTIDIFAYFLEKNYKDKLNKEGSDNIKQIRQSIMKMSTLIDNLLIYSKMGRSEIKYTKLNTEELIREVISDISKEEEIPKVQFVIANLPELKADYSMIKQALHNLVSNAVKFTRTKLKPAIEFYGHSNGEFVILAIRDNGVGFNTELKEKLFKPFKRLHSEEHFEGTGVGLAIVEKIIKRHDGQVWAESEENKGTTFFIKLPAH